MFNSWDSFLNSSFFTSFFGAVAGSATILVISWFEQKRKLLADMNSAIGVSVGLLHELLAVKEQHVLKLVSNYKQNLKARLRENQQTPGIQQLETNLTNFLCSELHYDISLERFFTLADKHPAIILTILEVKKTKTSVKNINERWNQMIDSMKNMSESEATDFYFGLPSPTGHNTTFGDLVIVYERDLDFALKITFDSIEELRVVAQKSLPFWLKKKIVNIDINRKYYADLIPKKIL